MHDTKKFDEKSEVETPKNAIKTESSAILKYTALFVLIFQNSGHALILRYSRIYKPASEAYIPTTAVICAELLKICVSTVLLFFVDCKCSLYQSKESLTKLAQDKNFWMDMLRLIVPSALYVVQNNLQYIAMR